jgi:hypothetical protein
MLEKDIYLIGHINPSVPQTYKWREEIVEIFKDRKDIRIVNPCTSIFDASLLEEGKTDPERFSAYRKTGVRLIVPKSFQCVQQSTMAIANMDLYNSPALSIGTIFELAWYYTFPWKSVIGIYTEGRTTESQCCAHPFVREAVHVWAGSIKEACKFVDTFF